MGKKSQYPGVEPVAKADGTIEIRINFRLDGRLRRKALNLAWNKRNCEAAAALRSEIVTRIKRGTFDWQEYWPEDTEDPEPVPTFDTLADQYLAHCAPLAKSTREGYAKLLQTHFRSPLGDKPIDSITTGTLSQVLGRCDWRTPKTRLNAITVLRGVFELAFLDGHIDVNPAARIKGTRLQRQPPDPFSLDERDRLLFWLHEHRRPWWPYFAFAFYTGLRSSELIALEWGDIDTERRIVRVQRARVRRETKGTKTATVRDTHLSPTAMAALQTQKAATFMRSPLVFVDPATDAQINDDKPPRLVLTDAMRALGIRHRPTYNTRHTRATELLTAGCNPVWVARQLGHRADTLFRHYARWIDEAQSAAEAAKVDGPGQGTYQGTSAPVRRGTRRGK